MQVNRNSVFHRFGLRCFNLFERLCRIRCVAIGQKSKKGARLEGVEQRGWGWNSDTGNLVQFIKSQQAGGWHSFCKWRRHFKATSDPLLCQAVPKWGAAQCSKQHETFQCPGVLYHIFKLVNGGLKVLPQTDFCMKGLQKMIQRKRLARGMMLFILDICCPSCENPEQCLVLKWRWQCRNSPFQWLGSCKGLPPGEEVVFSDVLHIAWPNAVEVGTAPRALLFPSAESCLEG